MPSQIASVQNASTQNLTSQTGQAEQAQVQTAGISTVLHGASTSDSVFVTSPSPGILEFHPVQDGTTYIAAVSQETVRGLPDDAILIDSKADVNVCPLSFASEYPLLPINEKLILKNVSGQRVRVHGFRVVLLEVLPNQYLWVRFIVADVMFPILSVCKLTDAGSEIVFRRHGGCLHLPCKFKIDIQRCYNDFYLKVSQIVNFHDSFEHMFHAEFVKYYFPKDKVQRDSFTTTVASNFKNQESVQNVFDMNFDYVNATSEVNVPTAVEDGTEASHQVASRVSDCMEKFEDIFRQAGPQAETTKLSDKLRRVLHNNRFAELAFVSSDGDC